MLKYYNELKTNETRFVLFNKKDFDNYNLLNGIAFNYEEAKLVLNFFYDNYDFDYYHLNNTNQYLIKLNRSLAQFTGYEFCGFYPIFNCKFLETQEMDNNSKNNILTIIKNHLVNRYIPNVSNSRIICFHNGNGEFQGEISYNPIIFTYEDISKLINFCKFYFNYDIEVAFHGKYNTSNVYLNEKMKSFFQKRIMSSCCVDDIKYSDNDFKSFLLNEKQVLIQNMNKLLSNHNE